MPESAITTSPDVGDQSPSKLAVLDVLRNLIARCLIRSNTTHSRAGVVITFEIYLNKDGSVAQPPLLKRGPTDKTDDDANRDSGAVRRAIYTCAPYHLPTTKYDDWQHSEIAFDLAKYTK